MTEQSMVERVKALFAKARSTTFPAEAAAFENKAFELMAKHGIDEAMLADADDVDIAVAEVTIAEPYREARLRMLDMIADVFRCEVMWQEGADDVLVVGFLSDLTIVELLYGSLSVQLHSELSTATKPVYLTLGQFRRDFIISFAARIRERLIVVHAAAVEEAAERHAGTPGAGLVPVLERRRSEVDQFVAEHFNIQSRVDRAAVDELAHEAGVAAANRADIGQRRLGG